MAEGAIENEGGPGVIASFRAAIRTTRVDLHKAWQNEGIRRLMLAWTFGIAADAALTVVTLVTVFNRGGIVAAAALGAVRMIPAIIVGSFSSSLVERFRGDRILVVFGMLRAVAAVGIGYAIASAGPTLRDHQITMILLFAFSTLAAAAAAPIRPAQITLMPAVARSTDELVAANTVWAMGEAVGAFIGPFVAGVLMAFNQHQWVAIGAGVGFAITSAIAVGLRFEHASDATGGGGERVRGARRFRLLDGLRAVRAKPLLGWTMFGTFWQVVTRGLLNALTVVAAIQLLGMGQWGTGVLSAALGLGGLAGALSAMTSRRSERLIRTMVISLFFWGAPLAVLGIVPWAIVALFAMVVIGIANATYDVALFTILQRGSANEDRAPVLSVLEVVIALGAIAGSLLAPVFVAVTGAQGGLFISGLILPLAAGLIYWRLRKTDDVTVVDDAIVHLLRQVPAFAELPMTAVERLTLGLTPITAAAGEALMRQGEVGDRFVLVESGEIEISVDGRVINKLGPGAGVGEIALLKRRPRTATVIAVTEVHGYAIDAPTFLAAIAGPAAAAVTERMAEANLQRSAAALAGSPSA